MHQPLADGPLRVGWSARFCGVLRVSKAGTVRASVSVRHRRADHAARHAAMVPIPFLGILPPPAQVAYNWVDSLEAVTALNHPLATISEMQRCATCAGCVRLGGLAGGGHRPQLLAGHHLPAPRVRPRCLACFSTCLPSQVQKCRCASAHCIMRATSATMTGRATACMACGVCSTCSACRPNPHTQAASRPLQRAEAKACRSWGWRRRPCCSCSRRTTDGRQPAGAAAGWLHSRDGG